MTYYNEAIVRNAYHTAEGNVLDTRGWIGSFTEDGVFNNVTGEVAGAKRGKICNARLETRRLGSNQRAPS